MSRTVCASIVACLSIPEPGPAEGGWLFTWGGVFTWTEQQRDKKGALTAQPDSNRGCLGLGDTLGRELPTRRVAISTWSPPQVRLLISDLSNRAQNQHGSQFLFTSLRLGKTSSQALFDACQVRVLRRGTESPLLTSAG